MRQADPTNPAVLYAAYRVYSDLAGEAMLSLALAAPDSAQMHQVMAHEEARQGNNEGARVQFQKALEIDPKLPGIHFELGELLGLSADPKTKAQAESEYKAAIAENPLDEKAETRLGDLSSRKGNSAQALQYYTAALRMQPDDADTAFGMAKTLIAMNQQAKALPLLERSVQLEPTNAAAHFRLSTIYREMGRTADSQHEVEEYKKYKLLKEKLEAVFKEMQIHPAGLPAANDDRRPGNDHQPQPSGDTDAKGLQRSKPGSSMSLASHLLPHAGRAQHQPAAPSPNPQIPNSSTSRAPQKFNLIICPRRPRSTSWSR